MRAKIPRHIIDRLIAKFVFCKPDKLKSIQSEIQAILGHRNQPDFDLDELRGVVGAIQVTNTEGYTEFLQEFGSVSLFRYLEDLDERLTNLEGRKPKKPKTTPAPAVTRSIPTPAMISDGNDQESRNESYPQPQEIAPCNQCGKPGTFTAHSFRKGVYYRTSFGCMNHGPKKHRYYQSIDEMRGITLDDIKEMRKKELAEF